jgi:type IV secretory pathway TrbF-like protein
MANAFKRPPKPFGDSTPVETPYQRAQQAWDDRIGGARVQARNWRIAAFGSMAIAAMALGGYIAERGETHVATYVIPVDRYGHPGRIELAGRAYQPTTAEVGYFLADWISWVRGRSPVDPIVNRANLLRAYSFVTGAAEGDLDTMAKASADQAIADKSQTAITAEVQSVLQRSPTSYQLSWTERSESAGQTPVLRRWTGLFTTRISPPKDEAALRRNPLGLFITNFQISQELG